MIYLTMPWPISINAYYMGRGNAKQRTPKGREWCKSFAADVWRQLGTVRPEPMIGPVRCWIELWPPDDRRKRDIDNFAGKHVLDALTRCGVWGDDYQIWDYRVRRRPKLGAGQMVIEIEEL